MSIKMLSKRILFGIRIYLLLAFGCSPIEKRPLSDHYDGRRFYNPTHPEMHGFWDAMKMLVSAKPAPWPEFVENHPDAHLDCDLVSGQAAVTFVNPGD